MVCTNINLEFGQVVNPKPKKRIEPKIVEHEEHKGEGQNEGEPANAEAAEVQYDLCETVCGVDLKVFCCYTEFCYT